MHYTTEGLNHILVLHQLWLDGNEEGECANLEFANLSFVDLQGANLAKARLSHADLTKAKLNGANLAGASLVCTNLQNARLTEANLAGANLSYANLSWALLEMANLEDANLRHANLGDAHVRGAKNMPKLLAAKLSILPEEGDVIGWKKLSDGKICKLLIPAGTKRYNGTSRLCRAECAQILEIWDGSKQVNEGKTKFNNTGRGNFVYRVGETLHVASFNDDPWDIYGTGILFFTTRVEAEEEFCPSYRERGIYANTTW